MKKLKHIINWTVWSLLALYVLLIVLIHVPAVQSWIGRTVATAIGSKLGTEVSVGRVDMGFLNRLIIDDVTILDQRQTPMISARRMAVKMDLLPLLEGRVRISSAQLFGAQATFYRDSAGATPNYQFALDALSSDNDDNPSALDLRIGSLIIRRLSMSYDQKDAPETPGRLNPQHLRVNDVSAHVMLKALTRDTLNVNLKRISLREQSGLDLRQLSFKAEGNREATQLTDFSVLLPHSTLSIDTLRASYDADSLMQTLSYDLRQLRTTIDPSDLQSLLPPEIPTTHTLDMQATFSGTTRSVRIPAISISTTDDAFALRASGRYDNGEWNADIDRLHANASLIEEVGQTWTSMPEHIGRLGTVSLSAQANGHADGDLYAQGNITTDIGSMAIQGQLATQANRWSAHIDTDSLDLQRLTANSQLGLLATSLDLTSQAGVTTIKGEVPRIDVNNYSYSHLDFDGTYSADAIAGKLRIDDPNLQADVEGSYGKSLRMTGIISRIAPQALHLSDRWADASFATIVDADITATSLADIQGTVDLDDFLMTQNDSTLFHLDNLHLRSGYEDQQHYVRLSSDFGEVKLKGIFNWNTLPQSFMAILPQADDSPRNSGNNDFSLSMQLADSRWMQQLLGIDLDLDGALSIDADVNDADRRLDISAAIPSFSYGDNSFRNALLDLRTIGDSTQCNARVTRMSDKGKPLHLKLDAQVADNEIRSALTLSNDGSDGGTINAITHTYKNDDGQRETHIRLMPSAIHLRGAAWELEPCDIIYGDKRLMVDQFTLHHDDEHIIIDGMASTLQRDSLMLDLQGVDVQSVLDMVNFHAVSFGGKASGKAYVTHAFSSPQAWADITVDDFLFQQAPMGTLEVRADWNDDDGQIDLDGAIDDGADAQTIIDGFISPRRKEIDLGMRARGTSIGFVHGFTSSFLGSISGHCYGDIRLHGPLSHIDLAGDAAVTGQASFIPLGTTYNLEGDTVHLSEGTIAFRDFRVTDRDGHLATLNGALHHYNFKNITFDLVAQAENLLAYDFPQMDAGSTIGGTVWANGQAVMRGRPGEVVIDCDVTPAPSSVFIYNAANPDAISRQQFITWGTSTQTLASAEGEALSSTTAGQVNTVTPKDKNAENKSMASDLRLNLRINATTDATLRLLMDQHSGDYITLYGTGVLRASYYNKGPFQMFGTYAVERGTYSMTIQNIIKKNFQFQPGSSLVFGGDPLQAALNLKAMYTVNGVSLSDLGLGNSFTSNTIRVNCLMNILGTAGEPRVEFDLEMPTVNSEEEQMIRSIIASEQELNQQVVYLLGIGRFYTQGANNAASQTYGQTELAMQSLLSGTVSSQINTLLSQVIKNDDWNFGANISTGNEGWHNAEYEGLVSGRMLNNRLLINGQFGYRDNATQATPSFIGDFDIRYLLTPSGNLALKAYNQTNDRYFTHSSLNTQGVGIIMKKDFNGFRDLFSPRKKRTVK